MDRFVFILMQSEFDIDHFRCCAFWQGDRSWSDDTLWQNFGDSHPGEGWWVECLHGICYGLLWLTTSGLFTLLSKMSRPYCTALDWWIQYSTVICGWLHHVWTPCCHCPECLGHVHCTRLVNTVQHTLLWVTSSWGKLAVDVPPGILIRIDHKDGVDKVLQDRGKEGMHFSVDLQCYCVSFTCVSSLQTSLGCPGWSHHPWMRWFMLPRRWRGWGCMFRSSSVEPPLPSQ